MTGVYRTTVLNAYTQQNLNKVTIPLPIIQEPFFTRENVSLVNYAGISFVLGHEMGHNFDNNGINFNQWGSVTENFTSPDSKKLLSLKVKCLIDQYSQYVEPTTKMKQDGQRTLPDNMADNWGLTAAYGLLTKSQSNVLPGMEYSARQQFWLALASNWCSRHTKEDIRHLIKNDAHTLTWLRVNGMLHNSEDFARDFKCAKGTNMNPEKKCLLVDQLKK